MLTAKRRTSKRKDHSRLVASGPFQNHDVREQAIHMTKKDVCRDARDRNTGLENKKELTTGLMSSAPTISVGWPILKEMNGPLPKSSPSVKFNEPVRKKCIKDDLVGIDYRQCKKLYATLEVDDVNCMMPTYCDHLNAVLRHRFKHPPLETPEGF